MVSSSARADPRTRATIATASGVNWYDSLYVRVPLSGRQGGDRRGVGRRAVGLAVGIAVGLGVGFDSG
jgi:hypothetical protein